MGCPRIARVTSSEVMVSTSKNNLKGIGYQIGYLGYKTYTRDSLSYFDLLLSLHVTNAFKRCSVLAIWSGL